MKIRLLYIILDLDASGNSSAPSSLIYFQTTVTLAESNDFMVREDVTTVNDPVRKQLQTIVTVSAYHIYSGLLIVLVACVIVVRVCCSDRTEWLEGWVQLRMTH